MNWATVFDEIIVNLKSSFPQFDDGKIALDNFCAFFRSVEWTEPWIVTLISFELTLFLLTLWFRRNLTVQTFLFLTISVVIYRAEHLNSILAQHWEKFATQPYFDKNGVFWSTIISGPLLLILFCILVSYMLEMMSLMVQVKKKQMILESKKQQESKKKK